MKAKLFSVRSGGYSTPWQLQSEKISVCMPQFLPWVFAVYSHTWKNRKTALDWLSLWYIWEQSYLYICMFLEQLFWVFLGAVLVNWLWLKALHRKTHNNYKLDFSQWYTIANTRFWSNQSICKVWSCYVQRFRRRCIYKKVHYLFHYWPWP